MTHKLRLKTDAVTDHAVCYRKAPTNNVLAFGAEWGISILDTIFAAENAKVN